MMTYRVIGWDIGGAHVKAVMLDHQGMVIAATQRACALWQGLAPLQKVLNDVINDWQLDQMTVMHAVTMTGELVDCFSHRAEGVRAIAQTMTQHFGSCRFYAANAQQTSFVSQVSGLETDIASMNWHASALCLQKTVQAQLPVRHALIVDIGSTTTDITACHAGHLQVSGWTDAERLLSGGLVYTGVVRTPLMAWGPSIAWQGRRQAIAAELFATSADVYRMLGWLVPKDDLAATADGQDKSLSATIQRIARMVGCDAIDHPMDTWYSLATAFQHQQLNMLSQVIQTQIAPMASRPLIIGLGAGHWLVAQLAQELGLAYQSATTLIPAAEESLQQQAAVAFPAYAVAKLYQQWH